MEKIINLISRALRARNNAQTPYSKYKVGAASCDFHPAMCTLAAMSNVAVIHKQRMQSKMLSIA